MNKSESYKSSIANKETSWWLKSCCYLSYICRKSAAFFMIWISIVLMFGVVCSHTNEMGQDEFYRFIFFLQHPFVIVVNVLALISMLFHTLTWFNFNHFTAGGKRSANILSVLGLWVITIVISVAMLLLVFGYFR